MLARILILAFLFVSQNGCSHLNHSSLNRVNHKKNVPIAPFSEVDITGNLNVKLHTGYATPTVVLSGDPRDLEQIKLIVTADGVLCLTLPAKYPRYGQVTADIRSRYLNGLVYHGSGSITGNHLRANLERVVIDNPRTTLLSGTIRLNYLETKGGGDTQIGGVVSPHLHVRISGQSKLKLMGVVSLRRLDMHGNSWFSLSWIKTTSLIVRTHDKAYIQLAGIVNRLDSESWDSSQVNARYLRARRAFVKTHDYSVAEISVTKHQHTLATDRSDIRTFKLPEIRTNFMAFDGAVLDMRRFDTAFVEQLTPYNE